MQYKAINITPSNIKTATDAIKYHLKKHGSITSLQAIKHYGATRLSGIIFSLKEQGYNISSTTFVKKTRYGRKARLARYHYHKPA